MTGKGTRESFWEANDVLLLGLGAGVMQVCSVCDNSPSCTLEICTSLYGCYTLVKSFKTSICLIRLVLHMPHAQTGA